MFATIRKYHPSADALTKGSIGKLQQQLHDEFIPIMQKIEGFHGYYALNVDGKELVTISVFETRAGATASNSRAAEYAQRQTMAIDVGRPTVMEGEVLTFAEAPREAGVH